jgi:hypothetical protein
MVTFNDHHNLTNDAEEVIRCFMRNEMESIDQDAVKALAGGEDYWFEGIEELTPRTLICPVCNFEVNEGETITDPDGDEIDACEGAVCPECLKDAPLVCNECDSKFNADDAATFRVTVGSECPQCPDDESFVGELSRDLDSCGELEYNEDDEHGGLPMWGTMWKCGAWLERKIQQDVTLASNAGFGVYQVEGELYLGVNGAGYSFMAPHFAVLYRAMTGDKLPGDPIIKCETCGKEYTRDELPEGATYPTSSSFLRESEVAAGLDVCACECGEGRVVARPFVTFEQKRKAQRDDAEATLQDIYHRFFRDGPETEFDSDTLCDVAELVCDFRARHGLVNDGHDIEPPDGG